MSTHSGPEMVDWDLAVTLGSRIAGDGPVVDRRTADAVVAELRGDADRSTGLVREHTGLVAAERTAPVLVVDRAGWVAANADGFATVLAPVVDKLSSRKGEPTGLAKAIGSRVTGAEVGALLGFLAGKVLGQFDPFHDRAGRLLLVAPNIVHEETHRVQFTATPWLAEHLLTEMHALADSLEPAGVLDEGLARIAGAIRSAREGGGSLLDLLGTPEQKEIVDRVTGVMSLLEGHADVVMDDVGPGVIPSVADIRKRFNRRRQGVGVLDKVLRRVLGLDAKMAQYRDGARFVRAVVDKAGMAEFNAVWERPENLPTKAEIADPRSWITRVL